MKNDWLIELNERVHERGENWKYNGKTIYLLKKEELDELKLKSPNEILISIFGEETMAKDCDGDTRFGYVAFGRLTPPPTVTKEEGRDE